MRHFLVSAFALAACGPEATVTSVYDAPASSTQRVSADGYLNKTTLGYQGWFATPDDGTPMHEWVHWSRGPAPRPGGITFELYPDTRGYPADALYDTPLPALGDGRPARLFSSHSQRVVDTHFQWMQAAGVDGVGLQRFIATLRDSRHLAFRDGVAQLVRSAAERTGRVFYLEYDISGSDPGAWVDELERDWLQRMRRHTDSPSYLRHGGLPVVAVWGLGFPDRPGTVAQAIDVINRMKGHGCYVVGGVPWGWRTGDGVRPGFMEAYRKLDVLQPWAVGTVATEQDADAALQNSIKPDQQAAANMGVQYQRVIFPGFAWSNWNGGAPNMIPRRAGRLFWAQAHAARAAGLSVFVAMFDEYDEGTAVAPAAEDATMAPSGQYFLTLDADGTRVSSDFYLRLAGAATRMLRGEAPHSRTIPIPAYEGGTPPPPPPPAGGGGFPAQTAAADVRSTPVADAGRAVARLYRAVLGREADPSGLGAYTPLVQQGNLARVVNALVLSGEFAARKPSLTPQRWAEALYKELLDRPSDPGGLQATAEAISQGRGPQRIADIVLSPEYAGRN